MAQLNRRTMTMGQWIESLGDAVPLEDCPRVLKMSPITVRHAVQQGELRVSTFRAVDGRVFRMVRRSDLVLYKKHQHTRPALSLEGMGRALNRWIEQGK